MSILLDFLTEEQLQEIRARANTTEHTYNITTSYGNLNKPQKAILNQYVRDVKYPHKRESILGSKTEEYSTEEQMLNKPKYSFNELTPRELAFYETYEKEKKNG